MSISSESCGVLLKGGSSNDGGPRNQGLAVIVRRADIGSRLTESGHTISMNFRQATRFEENLEILQHGQIERCRGG